MFWLDGRLSIRSGYPGRLNGQTRLPGCVTLPRFHVQQIMRL